MIRNNFIVNKDNKGIAFISLLSFLTVLFTIIELATHKEQTADTKNLGITSSVFLILNSFVLLYLFVLRYSNCKNATSQKYNLFFCFLFFAYIVVDSWFLSEKAKTLYERETLKEDSYYAISIEILFAIVCLVMYLTTDFNACV